MVTRIGLRGRSHGLSLVELLVGLAVGLFVLAGATFLATSQLHDGRKLLLEMQVQQDLRATADIVVRELRRAGFSTHAAQVGPASTAYSTIEAGPSEIRFRYGVDSRAPVTANEQFGFRLRNGAIEFELGSGNWQALTDTGALTVETFNITENAQAIALEDSCPVSCAAAGGEPCGPLQLVRHYTVDITARATSDPAVRRSIRAAVRPRNDAITGSCAS